MTTEATPERAYEPRPTFHDELFEDDGTPRPLAAALLDALKRLGPEGLDDAGHRRDAIFLQQGITFETVGEDGPSRERPFPLDLVPRILSGPEWRTLEARARAAHPRAEPLRRRRLPRPRDRP